MRPVPPHVSEERAGRWEQIELWIDIFSDDDDISMVKYIRIYYDDLEQARRRRR